MSPAERYFTMALARNMLAVHRSEDEALKGARLHAQSIIYKYAKYEDVMRKKGERMKR
jgi:hypothetical protein